MPKRVRVRKVKNVVRKNISSLGVVRRVMVNGLMTDDFGGIYTRAYDLETYTCTFFDRSLVFI